MNEKKFTLARCPEWHKPYCYITPRRKKDIAAIVLFDNTGSLVRLEQGWVTDYTQRNTPADIKEIVFDSPLPYCYDVKYTTTHAFVTRETPPGEDTRHILYLYAPDAKVTTEKAYSDLAGDYYYRYFKFALPGRKAPVTVRVYDHRETSDLYDYASRITSDLKASHVQNAPCVDEVLAVLSRYNITKRG